MTDVEVAPRSDGAFDVSLTSPSGTTHHRVTVPAQLVVSLGGDHVDQTKLVRESFLFLLEREPATAILGRFSLDIISEYFPEYRTEMNRRKTSLVLDPPAADRDGR